MVVPKLLLISLISGLLTQLIKFIIQAFRGEFRWSSLQEYGGMPSAHTAFVVSLSTVIGIHEGIDSAVFAASTIFSLLIIRDAIGLRQFLGRHAKIINMLVTDLPDDIEAKYPRHLVERVGHTPLQAMVGGIIGLALAIILYSWWF